jgi:hypothetical protein
LRNKEQTKKPGKSLEKKPAGIGKTEEQLKYILKTHKFFERIKKASDASGYKFNELQKSFEKPVKEKKPVKKSESLKEKKPVKNVSTEKKSISKKEIKNKKRGT